RKSETRRVDLRIGRRRRRGASQCRTVSRQRGLLGAACPVQGRARGAHRDHDRPHRLLFRAAVGGAAADPRRPGHGARREHVEALRRIAGRAHHARSRLRQLRLQLLGRRVRAGGDAARHRAAPARRDGESARRAGDQGAAANTRRRSDGDDARAVRRLCPGRDPGDRRRGQGGRHQAELSRRRPQEQHGRNFMRIVDIRETAIPLKSDLKNSSFDFSEMTTSVVAVTPDVVRDGKPVVGFAFNSTGRYACGAQMRARFIPRILKAEPKSLLDEHEGNLDPAKILAVMMQREKSGGHTERSIAVGTIEVAVWDAVAKIAAKPLHRVLAERYNGGKSATKVFCYVGGGWYAPGQTVKDLQDEMRRHLDQGYTMVKMKVGGLPLAEDVRRIEAVKKILPADAQLAVDANSKFGREEALAYAKALAPFQLRWFEEPCDPLDFARLAEIAGDYGSPLAAGENLFSTQDVENLVRFGGLRPDRNDVIHVDPPQAYGIVQYSHTVAMVERHGWPRSALFPHGGNQMSLAIAGGFGLGGAESYPGVSGAFGGFADDAKLQRGYLTLSDRPGIGF